MFKFGRFGQVRFGSVELPLEVRFGAFFLERSADPGEQNFLAIEASTGFPAFLVGGAP